MIGEVLDLDACRHAGLPVTDEIALAAGHRGEAGLFLLTAGGAAPWAGSPRRREA